MTLIVIDAACTRPGYGAGDLPSLRKFRTKWGRAEKDSPFQDWVCFTETRIFLYYLYRAPLFAALWIVWERSTGIGYPESGYLIFLLACPWGCFTVTCIMSRGLRLLPSGLGLTITGRTG